MIQKKIANFLFSTRLMAFLFVLFAVAMAIGTFIENSYSTDFARIYIYNTTWFELIMLLFAINFLGNIGRYNLLKREKWPTLILHLSFFLIILGAGVTRYISYEGMMPIREGETSNTVYSSKTYLTSYIDGETDGQLLRKKQNFHVRLAEGANNHHTFSTDFKGQDVEFEIVKFIEGAKKGIVEDKSGNRYLKIVESGEGKRHDHYLEEGKVTSIHNILFTFNKDTDGAINIYLDEDGNYSISSPFEGDYMRMADQKQGDVAKDSTQKLMLRSLYTMAGMNFVFPDEAIRGKYDVIHDESATANSKDGVVVNVKSKGETEQVKLLGSQGAISNFTNLDLGGLEMHLRYGSKKYELPFSLRLDDFIAEKYPGTANNPTPSYSSFKSKVELIDDGKKSKHEIYMNNVLDYEGYRFFQSSFQPDEKGTVLSVNHDFWGTNITYIGYYLLYLGLMMILLIKGSRFKNLERKLSNIKKFKKNQKAKITGMLALLFAISSFVGYGQVRKEDIPKNDQAAQHDTLSRAQEVSAAEHEHQENENLSTARLDSIIMANAAPEKQASEFGKLVIQDGRGRMKPVNTYSSELLRKLSKSNHYKGLNSDQVVLSMTQNPAVWYNVPIISIKAKDDSLHNILDIEKGKKHVKLTQFFDETGEYKLAPFLEEAYRAKVKNQFQKDFTETDGRVNLLYNALRGKVLRIFPIPHDEDNKWVSYPEALEMKDRFSGGDSLYVSKILPVYMQSLYNGKKSGNYTQANSVLESIKSYQKKFGAQIMPTETHIEAEILYNKYNIFEGLFWQYMLAGIFMFIFVILQIFYDKKWIHNMVTVGKVAVTALFVLHTAGLVIRWYISGHAPWSDAYESMIYVGWATVFFGLAFGRKSNLTIASTAFVAAIILMVAHWNWMDPSIGNLEPVLDSYWLMIHVAVIVASYGPFTLGMILALVTLLLMILTTKKNKQKMKLNIKELTIITEMSLTVGLVLLTIGNFLGGQWANESWGRYWSWDPKETWALISIMIYAFVIHMRLVPGLRNRFAFNWATILAFGSILMTYFGVNFYLAGLHSYASGDQIISYKFIGMAIGGWALIGFLAHRKFKIFYKK